MLLFRYFTRQLWQYFAVILVTIAIIIWLTQTVRYNDILADKGLDLFTIAGFVALLLPSVISPVTPYAFLIAVIFTLLRLVQRQEMVIIRSVGISPKRISYWVLINGAIVMVMLYIIIAEVSPHAYHKFKVRQHFLKRNLINFSLQPRTFNTPIPGLTIYVEEQNKDGDYQGLVMHDNRRNQPESIIIASKARLIQTASDEIIFELFEGSRHARDANGNEQILSFEYYPLNITQKAVAFSLAGQEAREMSLGRLIKAFKESNNPSFASELHHRIFWPLLIPTFSLIAILRIDKYHPRYHNLLVLLIPLITKIASISAIVITIQVVGKNTPILGYIGYMAIIAYTFKCWHQVKAK